MLSLTVQGMPIIAMPRDRPAPIQSSVTQPLATQTPRVEGEVINLINQERQRAGQPPLAVNAKLNDAAQIHADNMARLNQLDHILPGTTTPTPEDRLQHVGYSWSSYAENIAYNYPTASALVAGWMASPGHRANILSPNYTEIGVGVAPNSQGHYYDCAVFARPM